MPRTPDRLPLFAVTAPGLAPLAAAELAELGIAGARVDAAGVEWRGSPAELYDANLRLRTASRILLRLRTFTARAFWELEKQARKVPWETYVAPGGAVALRVTSRKSRLYHEGAIAERLLDAIRARIGEVAVASVGDGGGTGEDAGGDASAGEGEGAFEGQLFVVRVFRDRFTVSADTSGALLHRRGYRQATAKAPLRETLAAAMLRAAGWDGRSPLLDPLCGSGTIPIEAALLARRIPPGLASPDRAPRRYAFQAWPDFDAALWDDIVARARAGIRERADAPIVGSDRNGGAIRAARANAARAGVDGDVAFAVRPLSAIEPPPGPGWLVANPPYGVRVGERRALRDLYASLGNLARERLPGWTVALLSADRRLESATRLPLEEALRTNNGGIPVRVAVARVPAAPDA